jgi:Rrf2 family protein
MKLSTKGRYGTRFMIRLALAGPGAVCTLKQIAVEEDISEKYLWQIARGLKDAGYIHAAPGAHGGYRLARAPSTLTLGDILTALEGDLALVDCIVSPRSCRRSSECVARGVWQEVSAKIRQTLDGIRLDELVERHRHLQGDRTGEYSI